MVSATVKLPDGRSATVSGDSQEAVQAKIQQLLGDTQPDTVIHGGANPRMEHPTAPGQEMGGPGPQGLTPEDAASLTPDIQAFGQGAAARVKSYKDAILNKFRTPEERVDAAFQDIKTAKAQEKSDEQVPGGNPKGFRTAGKVAVDAGIGAVSSLGRGIGARVVGGGLAGAAATAADEPFSDNLAAAAAPGAGLGLLASTVGEVPNIAKNFVGSRIIKGYGNVGLKGSQDNALRATADARLAEIDQFPSEATGSGTLEKMESATNSAPGSPKFQAVRNRSDQIVASFERNARNMGASRANARNIVDAASKVYDGTVDSIADNARTAFVGELAPAAKIAGASIDPKTGIITGGKAIVPVPEYTRVLMLQYQAAKEAGASPGELGQILFRLKEATRRSNRLTLGGLQERLHQYGSGAYGRTGTTVGQALDANRYINDKQLYKALMDDLGNAADNLQANHFEPGGIKARFGTTGQTPAPPAQPGVGPALPPGRVMVEKGAGEYIPKDQPGPQARFEGNDIEGNLFSTGEDVNTVGQSLRNARDAFAAGMEPINRLKKQGIDQLLGSDKMLGSVEFAKRFRAMDTDQQKAVFDLLDSRRPELADRLRGVLFLEALDDAKIVRKSVNAFDPTTVEGTIDVPKFAANLSKNPDKLRLLVPKLKDSDAARVQAGLRTLSRITSANLEHGGPGGERNLMFLLTRSAQTAVSRNPIFAAGLLAGEVGPHVIEKWLYTPEGINALMKVHDVQPFRGAVSQGTREALSTLFGLAGQAEEERQALVDQAQAKDQQEQAQRGGMMYQQVGAH